MDKDLELIAPHTEDAFEEQTSDRLVFPINVHESMAASTGLKKGEKNRIMFSFWIVGSLLLAWFLGGWLRNILPNYYLIIVIGIELILQSTVGVILLRMLLDEKMLVSEADNQDNSFARYFGIYHEILSSESNYPFDLIEFTDGSYGVFIQFRLGHNTNHLSASTYDVNKGIQKLINKSGMPHKIVFSNEDFGNSHAANSMREVVKGIQDPRLFKVYRDIVHGVLNIANEESNLLCMTYIIYAKTRIHKEELTRLVTQILDTVKSSTTAYREVHILSYPEIVEFYRRQYKLDVIDMGMIRVRAVKRKNLVCALKLLRVYGKSGKVYETGEWKKLTSELLKEHGLFPVNKGV